MIFVHEFNIYTQSNNQLLKINIHVRSLNKKQKAISDIALDWGKKFVQNSKCINPILSESIRRLLTGGSGAGKFNWIKSI